MDGDIFGKATRLGRAAADALARAIDGAPFDLFLASKCLAKLISTAHGVPLLADISRELEAVRRAPLLVRMDPSDVIGRIRDASVQPGCSVLDLMLRLNFERAVLRGEFSLSAILTAFCTQLLDRAVVTGRGGFLESCGPANLAEARALLAPVAAAGAAELEARPTAKRLRLALSRGSISAETDLLGGT